MSLKIFTLKSLIFCPLRFVYSKMCLLVLCDDATYCSSQHYKTLWKGSIAVPFKLGIHYLLCEVHTYFFAFWREITCHKECKTYNKQYFCETYWAFLLMWINKYRKLCIFKFYILCFIHQFNRQNQTVLHFLTCIPHFNCLVTRLTRVRTWYRGKKRQEMCIIQVCQLPLILNKPS